MLGIIVPTEQEFSYIAKKDGVIYKVSGAGKINATIATMDLILNYKVSSVFCIGACGALDETKIGTVIIPDRIYQHDMDCTKLGYPYGVCLNENYEFLNNDQSPLSGTMIAESLASGDKIAHTVQDIALIRDYMKCNYADMESYAVAKCCFKYRVPFKCLRVVTDNSEKLGDWLTNIELAMKNLNKTMEGIYNGL